MIAGLTQRTRRVLAVITMVSLPLGAMFMTLTRDTSARHAGAGINLGLTLVALLGMLVLGQYLRDRWTMSRELDERQRHMRDRAVVISYTILLVCVALVVISLSFVVGVLGHDLTLRPIVAWPLTASFLTVSILPMGVLAWIEPDPPPDA